MQLALAEIKDTQYNPQECVIFNTTRKVPHNLQGIHHCIVNAHFVWLISRYWQYSKFEIHGSTSVIHRYNTDVKAIIINI